MERIKDHPARYILELNDRPWNAIKAGTKKVEARTPTEFNPTSYGEMQPKDEILFINAVSSKELLTEVTFVHHYRTVKELLEVEGTENVMSSSPKKVENGVKNISALTGYEEGIKKNGIYAIGLRIIQSSA